MTILYVYLLFSAATALTAAYELFYPAIREVQDLNPTAVTSEHPAMSMFWMTGMAFIMSPVIFLPCIVPSMAERFRKSLVNTLRKE